MPNCDHCDAHVSDRFARVFADENGRVRACPNCSANAGTAHTSDEPAATTPEHHTNSGHRAASAPIIGIDSIPSAVEPHSPICRP